MENGQGLTSIHFPQIYFGRIVVKIKTIKPYFFSLNNKI